MKKRSCLTECGNSRSRILRALRDVGLETAARVLDLRRLQWRNVDFVNRCLTFGKDKTRAGSRPHDSALTPRALETLKFWAEAFPDREIRSFRFPA